MERKVVIADIFLSSHWCARKWPGNCTRSSFAGGNRAVVSKGGQAWGEVAGSRLPEVRPGLGYLRSGQWQFQSLTMGWGRCLFPRLSVFHVSKFQTHPKKALICWVTQHFIQKEFDPLNISWGVNCLYQSVRSY